MGIKSQRFLIKNTAKIPQVTLMKTNDVWKVCLPRTIRTDLFRINNNSEVQITQKIEKICFGFKMWFTSGISHETKYISFKILNALKTPKYKQLRDCIEYLSFCANCKYWGLPKHRKKTLGKILHIQLFKTRKYYLNCSNIKICNSERSAKFKKR